MNLWMDNFTAPPVPTSLSVRPLVSVLVPTYGRPDQLARCLEALSRQTVLPDEVIVVARDSDHETRTFLRNSCPDNLHMRCPVISAPGQIASLNLGLDTAEGDILAITDDDTCPHPDWIGKLVAHFVADPEVVGVGGRDIMFFDGKPETGAKKVVGKIQWFGRIIGLHHLGTGPIRDVDCLKGANMAFRHAAIGSTRFDVRLRGSGAEWYNDTAFCLAMKRGGARLTYDPAMVVDHFPGTKPGYDQRDGFNARAAVDHAHNYALLVLENVSPFRRFLFLTWATLIGLRIMPGLANWVRLVIAGEKHASEKFGCAMRGVVQGVGSWLSTV